MHLQENPPVVLRRGQGAQLSSFRCCASPKQSSSYSVPRDASQCVPLHLLTGHTQQQMNTTCLSQVSTWDSFPWRAHPALTTDHLTDTLQLPECEAQINVSTQRQMWMFLCGVEKKGIVKKSVGMALGWEGKVQLFSAPSQYYLYFGLNQHGMLSCSFLLKTASCTCSWGALPLLYILLQLHLPACCQALLTTVCTRRLRPTLAGLWVTKVKTFRGIKYFWLRCYCALMWPLKPQN